MLLGKDAEIKTGDRSLCTLAFDEELKNIMTVKENSHIKLDSIIPAKVFLPEGRVFSLIDNLSAIEKFEVRTPTAIAGARGTGLSVKFLDGKTVAICYEHLVYVMSLDKQGIPGELKELAEKFGVTIGPDGFWQGPFALSGEDLKEWKDFMAYLDSLLNNPEGEGNSPTDLQEDAQDSRADELYEMRRQEEEGRNQGREINNYKR